MALSDVSALGSLESRIILGLMSGTSVDGLDMAVCRFTGSGLHTQCEVMHFDSTPYSAEQRAVLLQLATSPDVNMEAFTLIHTQLAHWHAAMIGQKLKQWDLPASGIDVIASHGQTVRHAPARIHNQPGIPNATLQIGDADHLAYLTGIPVISDFRQKHVAAGGEGAPLSAYGDAILFSNPGEFRILLNIGGISNITVLDGQPDSGLPLTFDTGPGNTLMDKFIRLTGDDARYDDGGRVAALGKVHQGLLQALKTHPYYQDAPPKTTGPELLSTTYVEEARRVSGTTDIAVENLLATLNRLSAETIAEAILRFAKPPGAFTVYVSGGGVHNPVLMENLAEALPQGRVTSFAALGIDPDAKEAVLFAAMANEFLCGNRFEVTDGQGNSHWVSLGRLSLAD